MRTFGLRGRLALAATLAAAAIGSAAPARADVDTASADCDARLTKLVDQFYEMADRRGYEPATEWWQARWHAHFESCIIH